MRFQVRQPAGDGTRFAPTAWDGQVGKVVPFRVGDREDQVKLVAASVVEDGAAVLLTFETSA